MDLVYFILAAYGMTFIIVYGKIFEDIRPNKDYTKKWNTLFHCPLCMGFWVGEYNETKIREFKKTNQRRN